MLCAELLRGTRPWGPKRLLRHKGGGGQTHDVGGWLATEAAATAIRKCHERASAAHHLSATSTFALIFPALRMDFTHKHRKPMSPGLTQKLQSQTCRFPDRLPSILAAVYFCASARYTSGVSQASRSLRPCVSCVTLVAWSETPCGDRVVRHTSACMGAHMHMRPCFRHDTQYFEYGRLHMLQLQEFGTPRAVRGQAFSLAGPGRRGRLQRMSCIATKITTTPTQPTLTSPSLCRLHPKPIHNKLQPPVNPRAPRRFSTRPRKSSLPPSQSEGRSQI